MLPPLFLFREKRRITPSGNKNTIPPPEAGESKNQQTNLPVKRGEYLILILLPLGNKENDCQHAGQKLGEGSRDENAVRNAVDRRENHHAIDGILNRNSFL